MILEVAILNVRSGQTAAFEKAFRKAERIIAAVPGYISHELQRCVEVENQYVLLVRWRALEDHTEGFRQSSGYADWKRLLHDFYDPFPTVQHYCQVAGTRSGGLEIQIRDEQPVDCEQIREVHVRAFGGGPNRAEAALVDLLRERKKAPIALVAVKDGRVAGHVMFSPVTVANAPPNFRVLGLAPVAVLPELQGRGIGSQLVSNGLERCRRDGYDAVVVLGDPNYYHRFGFSRGKGHQLDNEYSADDDFMVIELGVGKLQQASGLVKYSPEFREAGC
jgi:putative acetyltransferase